MTPLELVNKSVVSRVKRTASGRKDLGVDYFVTVRLPNGGEVVFNHESRTSWRRVAKKAGLKLTSNAARDAAAALRGRIDAAVVAEKANPAGALIDSKILAKSEARRKKSEDMHAAKMRADALSMVRKLMQDYRMTKEEVLEAWNSSVIGDVMST
jgi:signal recognition particle subunit SEC65